MASPLLMQATRTANAGRLSALWCSQANTAT